jgi:hypothetical protein
VLFRSRAVCWGFDFESQYPAPKEELADISLAKPMPKVVCGTRRNGSAVCWGEEPVKPHEKEARAIRAGTFYSCSLGRGTTAECWPTSAASSRGMKPFEIRNPNGVKDVSLSEHMCFLDGRGRVACAGLDEDSDFRAPGFEFSQISVGIWVACGVTKDGNVECWGYGIKSDGRPAPAGGGRGGETGWEIVPVDEEGSPMEEVVYQIKDLYRRNSPLTGLALTFSPDDYRVVPGQRRSESDDWNLNRPPQCKFRYVSTYGSTACAVRDSGSLVCWGECQFDMCDVPSGSYRQVDVGPMNACAIREDGRAVCWGSDEFGLSTPP